MFWSVWYKFVLKPLTGKKDVFSNWKFSCGTEYPKQTNNDLGMTRLGFKHRTPASEANAVRLRHRDGTFKKIMCGSLNIICSIHIIILCTSQIICSKLVITVMLLSWLWWPFNTLPFMIMIKIVPCLRSYGEEAKSKIFRYHR